MFDENQKEKLEKQVLNLASETVLALRKDRALEARDSMMKILVQLSDEHNSSKLLGNRTVKKAVALGFDERREALVRKLKVVVDDLINVIEGGDKPDFSRMRKLDAAMMDLLDRRI